MEQTKEAILSSVEYTNLLTLTLAENKLERNFRLLVEALSLTQTNTDGLKKKIALLQSTSSNHTLEIASLQQRIRSLNPQTHPHLSIKQVQGSAPKIEPSAPRIEIPPSAKSVVSKQRVTEKALSQREALSQVKVPLIEGSLAQKALTEKDLIEKVIQATTKPIALTLQMAPSNSFQPSPTSNECPISNAPTQCERAQPNPTSQSAPFDMKKLQQALFTRFCAQFPSRGEMNGRDAALSEVETLLEGLRRQITNLKAQVMAGKKPRSKISLQKIVSAKMDNKQNEDAVKEDDLEREFNGLHVEVNTINISLEELRQTVHQMGKKQGKGLLQLGEAQSVIKKMQMDVERDHQSMVRQIKEISSQSIDAPLKALPKEEGMKKETFKEDSFKEDAFRASLADKLNKMQIGIQQAISSQEFKRFKQEIRGKITTLQAQSATLKSQFEAESKKLSKEVRDSCPNRQLAQINQRQTQANTQIERKHNIAIARVQQLKKAIQNLRQDVQYYRTLQKEQPQQEQPVKVTESSSLKQAEQLKRYFVNKMHDQRTYLVGQLRDLEKKMAVTSTLQSETAAIWDRLSELASLGAKKVDVQDLKKSLTYLEKKIVRVASSFVKEEEGGQDARAAKTNWLCLSCDKSLTNYHGRVGRHIVWDSLPKRKQVFPVLKK